MSKRKEPEFTDLTKAKAFARANGKCEICGFILKKNNRHYDHIKPVEMGGKSDLDNCRLLCIPCHQGKTAEEDTPVITRNNKQMKTNAGFKKRKYPPMSGTIDSGWKHKMNNTWERRQ